MNFRVRALFLFLLIHSISSSQTKVILLGTGTPNPDPERSGGSIAVVVGTTSYIIDFGPEGTKNLTDNILKAYDADIKYRLYGLEPANNQGWRVTTHEFYKDGLIYKDSLVNMEAFKVVHGSWPNAFGFRFTTPDKIIVLSGDTKPCENILKYAEGVDILIHEVYSFSGWQKKDEFWKAYHADHHTSTYELGEIAAKAKPGKIVLNHLLFWGASEQDLLNEIYEKYDGEVIVGKDLMVIE